MTATHAMSIVEDGDGVEFTCDQCGRHLMFDAGRHMLVVCRGDQTVRHVLTDGPQIDVHTC